MYMDIYIYTCTLVCCRFKRKTETQENVSLIRLQFAYRANGSLSFVDEETHGRIYLQKMN